ncbi:MAG TPA: hypothetical protein EYP53_01250 [Candidatus Latescibacteria bacterium]|nr:hypothetical protein [Candidatus Latescibacterota bacterium]
MREKRIVFLNLKNFYIQAESSANSELNGQPLAVFRGSRVIDACRVARREGVREGMLAGHARRICPGLVLLPYNRDRYRHLFREVWDLVACYSPLIEPIDLHQGFFDLTGCLPRDISLKRRVREIQNQILLRTGLSSRAGGGPNKLLARLAARKGVFLSRAEAKSFLTSTPLKTFGWIDQNLIGRLHRLGVTTLGELISIPEGLLASQFPRHRSLLHRLSSGIDPDPVRPLYPPRSLEEEIQFDTEQDDWEMLQNGLSILCNRLAQRLRGRGEEALEVSLTLYYRGRKEEVRQSLTRPIGESRRILRAVSLLLQKNLRGRGIVGIRISLSELRSRRAEQLDLFNNEVLVDRYIQLQETMEMIRQRYGQFSLFNGGELKRRRPERMARLIFEQQGRWLP